MELLSHVSRGPILAGAMICAVTLPLGAPAFQHAKAWRHEFFGTIVMIACTFPAGKWWGASAPGWYAATPLAASIPFDWVLHWVGVLVSDYSCGGPQVNTGVSVSMLALGKIGYTQFVVHVAAQMAGGLVAFPVLQRIAAQLDLTPLGGPAISADVSPLELRVAATHEFLAAFLLLCLVYAVNWEPPTSAKAHKAFYFVKQSLTAFGIRGLVVFLGAAGPAANSMLATTWFVCANGTFPTFKEHYLVYWGASLSGALVASLVYALYSPNETFFGKSLRGTKAGTSPKKQHTAHNNNNAPKNKKNKKN